ncbi:Uncharacterized protein OS=Flavobacterium subsaxonicum WB 4.1-42 = DSM 21790 GN=Q766_00750 PE=4 SV=1 [Gemmata massiliana]|uniref:Uncharacterized protein n=1 Tax=Gemmata massiliana TaxID=1210884 RepID=A0A6P2CY17_9BACT|nr:hypothetical protein [Gemmata massiliana]VTR92022.1 Uncharacterized protein OS=Flavobacterium subsaxonicum WB 4.1-42 = DSM 21790 GN=Q766_00750 PE=4 SV=1 [Gemmata massiliana]
MSLDTAYTGVRVLETLANYTRARSCPPVPVAPADPDKSSPIHDEEQFWWQLFANPTPPALNRDHYFYDMILTEWVPRVPGLYWRPESEAMRSLTAAAIESQSERFTTYTPGAKSRKVFGGIGTFRLPQDVPGYQLLGLTRSMNASAAIPILLSPDDQARYSLKEGTVLSVQARWQSMARGWDEHFPIVAGIPRGYLVPTGPNAIYVQEAEVAPVQIHPFTLMRYDAGPTERFDFVYATADTGDPNYRGYLAQFFDSYRVQNGRAGEYLLPGDHVDPLWGATYNHPSEFTAPGNNPLRLLEERVRNSMINGEIDSLIEKLAGLEIDDMKRYSVDVGIPHSQWVVPATPAQCANRFVEKAIALRRVDALIERAVIGRPTP